MNEDDILDEIENEQYKNFISRIATDLMKMNFSDMVEVVRCGECKFYNGESCTVRLNLFGFWVSMPANGYCSSVERRCWE